MNRPVSLYKIVTVDYVAFQACLYSLVVWALYVLLLFLGNIQANQGNWLAIAGGITIISLLVLVWRIRLFSILFSDGIEAQAKISNLWFYRDRGRVEYVFTYQGQEYKSSNMVHRVKETRSLQIGDQVTVIVDRNHPKRAYIRDLYV